MGIGVVSGGMNDSAKKAFPLEYKTYIDKGSYAATRWRPSAAPRIPV